MKGRSVTKEQKKFHDNLCRIVGCPCCWIEGNFNNYVSIHHIDGRTKPDAHYLVLPLCGNHHQIGDGCEAVHKNKARFERQYGSQMTLYRMSIEILIDNCIDVPERALELARFK